SWSSPRSKPRAQDLVLEGFASLQLGDCDQSLQSFASAVDKAPKMGGPWWGIGVCLIQQGETDRGIAALKRASIVDPKLSAPHYSPGLTYASQGNRRLALEQYEVLKRLDPEMAEKLKSEIPSNDSAR